MKNTRKFVFMALLMALEVILTRFLSIQTPIVRIGFGFLPIALAGMMFGPLYAGAMAALADIIGMMLFPSGAYFAGFTVSAFISGVIYGIFLYKKDKSIVRITFSVVLNILIVDTALNTIWLTMILNKAFIAIMAPRIIKNVAMIPIEVVVIFAIWKAMEKSFGKQYMMN